MTEKNKKASKSDPTPWLNKPSRDKKIFTYSENRLLDQITTEIMEAWKNDLIVIQRHHKEILKSEESSLRLSKLISNQFPELEKFLKNNKFIESFNKLTNDYELMNFRIAETNSSLFRMEEKLSFPRVKELMESIEELKGLAKQIKQNMEKKPWWKRMF